MTHRCQPQELTYTATYVACSTCRQRWFWTDRGWQPNPRLGPPRYGRG